MKEKPKTPIQYNRIWFICCCILTTIVLVLLVFRLILQAAEPFSHDTLTTTGGYIFIHLFAISAIWCHFIIAYTYYVQKHDRYNQ